MNTIKLRNGLVSAIIVLLVLTACGGGGDGGEPAAPPASEAPAPAEQVAPTEPQAGGTEGAVPAPAEPTEAPAAEIPFDLPIMEGATKLDIRDTGAITYVMQETQIEDVVEFYNARMGERGWESVSASEVGLMATLVFQTDVARVSVSLQANNIARTVNVQLIVYTK